MKKFSVGPFDNNVYVVASGHDALIVDGANDADRILAEVDAFRVVGIVQTHGHFDHAGSTAELKRRLRIPSAVHVNDAFMLRKGVNGEIKPRNFEARVHQNIKANFLMSPPLVVAFALAGNVNVDLSREPLGKGKDGKDVYLRDIWPSLQEIRDLMQAAMDPATYRRLYADFAAQNPLWGAISSSAGAVYQWDRNSTYIQEPPFFTNFTGKPGTIGDIIGARPLAILGDSVTTDHISPAGSIKASSPAGR